MWRLKTTRDKRLFISWVRYTSRSESLATMIGAQNHFISMGGRLGVLKYLPRGLATARLLLQERPRILLCMNPPYFLGLVGWLYTLVFDAQLVLDSHTAAFDSRKWTWMKPLHAIIARRAVCCIVTNAPLAAQVRKMGGTAVLVADVPHTLPQNTHRIAQDGPSVCYVCTFASDEPVVEVLQAARMLPPVRFYITGDYRKARGSILDDRPANVTFTGYISNDRYAALLQSVDVILVLTTRNYTMQRGGSEAISTRTPLIVSDWPVLRETFTYGSIHVKNTAAEIAAAIQTVLADPDHYRKGMEALAKLRDDRWLRASAELKELLPELAQSPTGQAQL